MEIHPRRRVGAPASFKGVRGDYLMTLIFWIVGLLMLLFLVFTIFKNFVFIILCILMIFGFLIYKFLELKKLSKGDMYLQTKKMSRKKIIIKASSKIHYAKKN